MSYGDVGDILETSGVPAYLYDLGQDSGLVKRPYIIYFPTDSPDLRADDSNYLPIKQWTAQLYEDDPDGSLERAVIGVLNAHHIECQHDFAGKVTETGPYMTAFIFSTIGD